MSRRRYTEQQFRDAVADPKTKTMADLCRALGIVPRGANYETLRALARDRGISLNGLRMLTRDAVDDETFASALAASSSYPEVCRRLGMNTHSGTHRRIDARAGRLGLTVPPEWRRPGNRSKTPVARVLPGDLLCRAVVASFSVSGVARELGSKPTAAMLERIRHSIEVHGLDTSHFGTPGRRVGLEAQSLFAKLATDTRHNSHKLGRQLVELGLKPRRCGGCRGTSWQGVPMPLELDHTNGVRTDNRFGNLRLLCPNCHALTPTYRGRNIGRSRRVAERAAEPVRTGRPARQSTLW